MGASVACLTGRRKSEEPGGALVVEECLVGLGLGGGFRVMGGRGGAFVEEVGMVEKTSERSDWLVGEVWECEGKGEWKRCWGAIVWQGRCCGYNNRGAQDGCAGNPRSVVVP
jgi:hypothetical protein